MLESIRCPFVPGLSLRIALAVIALAAPPALADTLSVPAQFASIGDAVAAAQPGDTINVAAGEYRENVTINVADVTLKGSGVCILDARAGGTDNGAGLIITATGVTISNLTVRHASTDDANDGDGIRSTAFGTTLDKVRVFNSSENGFRATGNGMRVLNSLFRGGSSIRIEGDDALVEKTVIQNSYRVGIDINGSGAVLRKCTVLNISGDGGIRVEGDNTLVEACTVTHTNEAGISVSGLNPAILKNSVSRVNEDDCILVRDATTGGNVSGNRCFDSSDDGMELNDCNMVTVSGNKLERIGYGSSVGLYVEGNDNTVSGNSIKDGGGYGFYIRGDTNTLSGNKVSGCTTDGLRIDSGSGNVILSNKVTGNMGEGIENDGTGTVCNSNTVQQNRTDIAGTEAFAEFTGNKFTTGGELEPPQID